MANPPSNAASSGPPFAPRALVPVNIGHSTVNLYPVIDPIMQPHERTHAFYINKRVSFSQTIDLQIQLNALGHQLNLSTTVNGLIHNWLRHYSNLFFYFSHLVILSFHDKKGNQVSNTTIAGNPSILLPLADGAIANCCRHIKFVRAQLSVNFIDLVTINHPGPTTLLTNYYIKLPQKMCPMTNETCMAHNLMTFHGAADLCTSVPARSPCGDTQPYSPGQAH
jgi:hypothetical protein